MSKGIVHTQSAIALSTGFLIGGIATGDISCVAYAAGSLIGILISPDLDVDNGFDGDRHIRNKIGKWAEVIWDGFWNFYRRSLKHGGELSHFPVIGTIGRIIYIYGFLIVIPHVTYYFIFNPQWDLWHVLEWYVKQILDNYRLILGLMGVDTIHFFLDIWTKEHKEKKKNKFSPAHIIGGKNLAYEK